MILPKGILYVFCKLESIENIIYDMFFEKTIELLQKDDNYETYDMKSKLLSFTLPSLNY
jgi:hypothetical protein